MRLIPHHIQQPSEQFAKHNAQQNRSNPCYDSLSWSEPIGMTRPHGRVFPFQWRISHPSHHPPSPRNFPANNTGIEDLGQGRRGNAAPTNSRSTTTLSQENKHAKAQKRDCGQCGSGGNRSHHHLARMRLLPHHVKQPSEQFAKQNT